MKGKEKKGMKRKGKRCKVIEDEKGRQKWRGYRKRGEGEGRGGKGREGGKNK